MKTGDITGRIVIAVVVLALLFFAAAFGTALTGVFS